ncbi:hypothetical protein DE146DRAFT_632586 [Phaeosphaeria sp. MPI-PUGE-AT-0046c]|nr:hypothetical protein DE146DRAFT_632586 [Phaeosphaeria sp. MPI-PUGE-AT-0046c]
MIDAVRAAMGEVLVAVHVGQALCSSMWLPTANGRTHFVLTLALQSSAAQKGEVRIDYVNHEQQRSAPEQSTNSRCSSMKYRLVLEPIVGRNNTTLRACMQSRRCVALAPGQLMLVVSAVSARSDHGVVSVRPYTSPLPGVNGESPGEKGGHQSTSRVAHDSATGKAELMKRAGGGFLFRAAQRGGSRERHTTANAQSEGIVIARSCFHRSTEGECSRRGYIRRSTVAAVAADGGGSGERRPGQWEAQDCPELSDS